MPIGAGVRSDPARRQIQFARWVVWFMALATPGFVVLLIGATWSIASDIKGSVFGTVLGLIVLWVVFLSLLIVPEVWMLMRIWRGIPYLQIDAWGMLWGDDWSRDMGIEWHEISRIQSRWLRSHAYSDRMLLIDPVDPQIWRRFRGTKRWSAWLGKAMYGTPFAVALGTLRIKKEELLTLIRQHYQGEIDLSGIE